MPGKSSDTIQCTERYALLSERLPIQSGRTGSAHGGAVSRSVRVGVYKRLWRELPAHSVKIVEVETQTG